MANKARPTGTSEPATITVKIPVFRWHQPHEGNVVDFLFRAPPSRR
jgi:hypothetical protein